MKRYKELKYEDKSYTESYKIDEILVKNKFEWFLDCEVENCRLEITKGTLVFNSGVFFNGTWEYGVFRDGQWKYGTWMGGVWYNGTWYNGIFKNGIIFGGRFLNGKIEGGEIRGGEFFDCKISKEVANTTIQKTQPQPQAQKPMQGEPQNRGQQEKQEEVENPQVQGEPMEERIMKYKTYLSINEGLGQNDIKRLVNFIIKTLKKEYDLKVTIEYHEDQTPVYFFSEKSDPNKFIFYMGYGTRRPSFTFHFIDNDYADILDPLIEVEGLDYAPRGVLHRFNVTGKIKDILSQMQFIEGEEEDIDEENDEWITESLNKYLVSQEIPYESKLSWTVIADSPEEAKEFVKKERYYDDAEKLSVDTLKSNITGTNEKGVKKSNRVDY